MANISYLFSFHAIHTQAGTLPLQLLSNSAKIPNTLALNNMIESLNRNIIRASSGFRYNEELKLFMAHLRMVGGPYAYENFRANNVGAVPSVSAINQYIADRRSYFEGGVVRIEELNNYLSNLHLPKIFSLSEDATRITGRVQYDQKNNQIVGFVLPVDSNSMPISRSYPARTASEIERYFYDVELRKEKQPANYINVVMAQPLVRGIPPICLMLYGTDNKYSAIAVGKRWAHISSLLQQNGIKVIAFGSDSDPRSNSAMRKHLQFGAIRDIQCEAVPGWFGAEFNINMEYYPIQDTVHNGTKFRNKLLNQSLKFGRHIISVDSLHTLIKLVTKEKHRLTETIIKPNDRQNFESVLRISDIRVIDLLVSKVENSQGIVFYLKMVNNVLRSFLDLRMTAVERIRAIWFATFLLRIWKVDQLKKKKLQSNFITILLFLISILLFLRGN